MFTFKAIEKRISLGETRFNVYIRKSMFILFFLAVSMLYKLKNLEPILLEFLENVIESRF